MGWKTKGKRGVGTSEIFSHKFSIEFHYERTNEHKRTQTLCVRAIPRGFPRDRDHMERRESFDRDRTEGRTERLLGSEMKNSSLVSLCYVEWFTRGGKEGEFNSRGQSVDWTIDHS